MSNRYVRLYESPIPERAGSVLGFSLSFAAAAYDADLHDWLEVKGYRVSPERSLGFLAVLVSANTSLPEQTAIRPQTSVSFTHLFVEPPIAERDLEPLGDHLSCLQSCDTSHNSGYFVDNRAISPEQETRQGTMQVLANW